MSLSARRIATQGFGGGPLPVALHGFVPVAVPAPADVAGRGGSAGGGVISSATISLSEWLRLVEKRAATGLPPVALPIPIPASADVAAAAVAARTRRRRAEEELLLLIG